MVSRHKIGTLTQTSYRLAKILKAACWLWSLSHRLNFMCLHACLGFFDSSIAVMVCPHWPHYSDTWHTSTWHRPENRYCRYCRYPDQDTAPSSGNLTAPQIHLLFKSHSATNIALICTGICILYCTNIIIYYVMASHLSAFSALRCLQWSSKVFINKIEIGTEWFCGYIFYLRQIVAKLNIYIL